ncbi:MAG: helix-turn-helix domain-containing protein [Oscillospiraceae bacterium]|nr:helix-turn-helix domain-containing protein [Oscillospiraceae bacterium]
MDIEKKLTHQAFLNREESISHLAYERENAFFQSIQDGDADTMRKLYKPFDSGDMGKLSNNPVRNLQYHLIITVALITRTCIEGGMEMEEAYNLSDIYIRGIDSCKSEDDVRMLHKEVVEDYTQRMYLMKKKNRYPKAIVVCMDYIYDNLHTKLTLPELANASGLTPPYLSRLFRKEVGLTISEYIMKKRIEAAQNMLRYSEYSCIAISDYLCFSSESHFIHVFRQHTGYTPRKYREQFFRVRKKESVNNL